jgi:hypothetical protein
VGDQKAVDPGRLDAHALDVLEATGEQPFRVFRLGVVATLGVNQHEEPA